MRFVIKNSFERDTKKIHDKILLTEIEATIRQIEAATGLTQISKFKKLKGYKHYYRIRIRDYRIGISFENNRIFLARFLHRGEIYKVFPPK